MKIQCQLLKLLLYHYYFLNYDSIYNKHFYDLQCPGLLAYQTLKKTIL